MNKQESTIDRNTRYFILGVVGIIIFLSGVFVDSDWLYITSGHKNNYTFLMKYTITILTFIIAWRSEICPVSKRDVFYLKLAFVFTLVGDLFLVALCGIFSDTELTPIFSVAGILAFCVVQVIYIIRHGRSFITFPIKLNFSNPPTQRRLIATVLIYGLSFTLLAFLYPYIIKNGKLLIIPALLYIMLLATSLWAAWGVLIKSWYPHRNAWLIAGGLSFLIACDTAVGVETFITGVASLIANGFVWIFYAPSLVLLSLSGYNWYGYEGGDKIFDFSEEHADELD